MKNAIRAMCLGLAVAGSWGAASGGQEQTPAAPAIEAELDRFREGLFHAFNEGNYRAMLEEYCHPNVIATWQDGTTSQGYDQVLAEFEKLQVFIASMTADPATDKRLILNDGQLVVASGNMGDVYSLKNHGVKVELHSRWQATLIRDGDRFLLIGFSASTNAFENQVVDLYVTKTRYIAWAVGGGVGLVAGLAIAYFVFARRRPPRALA